MKHLLKFLSDFKLQEHDSHMVHVLALTSQSMPLSASTKDAGYLAKLYERVGSLPTDYSLPLSVL